MCLASRVLDQSAPDVLVALDIARYLAVKTKVFSNQNKYLFTFTDASVLVVNVGNNSMRVSS